MVEPGFGAPAEAVDPVKPFERIGQRLASAEIRNTTGRITGAVGTVVRATLPGARVGELVRLADPGDAAFGLGEVVGLEGEAVLISPYGGVTGLSTRTEVSRLRTEPSILVGDHLLGAIVDSTGRVERPPLLHRPSGLGIARSLNASPPATLDRRSVTEAFATGVRAIDAMMTAGRGQRVGIYGSPGTGKSTLIGMLVDRCEADVIVVALVGERGREVADFVARHMDGPSADRIVLVAATSDRPSLERLQAALAATTIAEHFRDRGCRVLLIVDSVTRLARALREIGLASGEPPVRRGFPPSVFTALPRIFERAGNVEGGSITAFYTVLVEGDIASDPIAEETRSLLDGHIILSEKLVSAGWYPAIDVIASRSRTMGAVVDHDHRKAADRIRALMDRHGGLELLVRLGEYQPGRNAEDDEAMTKWPAIASFLKQDVDEEGPLEATISRLLEIAS